MGIEHRGFASMDLDTRRAIASKGGKAAHAKGTAHTWTPEEAKAAGAKGGAASRGKSRRPVPAIAAALMAATLPPVIPQ